MGNGPGHTDFTVTAVAGHLTSSDFDDQYRKWSSCDPRDLFDARIRTFVTQVRLPFLPICDSSADLSLYRTLIIEASKRTSLPKRGRLRT